MYRKGYYVSITHLYFWLLAPGRPEQPPSIDAESSAAPAAANNGAAAANGAQANQEPLPPG